MAIENACESPAPHVPDRIKSGGCAVPTLCCLARRKEADALETWLAINGIDRFDKFEETRQMADLQQLEEQIVGLSLLDAAAW